MDNEAQEDVGGSGGSSPGDADELIGRKKTTRLEQRALRQRWNIPDNVKQAIANRQAIIAAGGDIEYTDPDTGATRTRKPSPREITAAAKAIALFEGQNMEQERRDLQIPEYVEERVTIVPAEEMTDDELAAFITRAERSRD
jgi:hypothetical protein